jgi:protein-S-isoprenylcysteine O-methyltransferase Ste14
MDNAFLIPAVVFLLCLGIRAVYEQLKDAGKVNLESKTIFAFIFASMIVLWISWFSLCPADPFRIDIPEIIRWLGFAVFIFGLVIALAALAQLRGVENIDHLVTSGVFKKIRHPMYVGFISWILGWSVYHGAYVSLAIGLPGIASVLWWRHLEEIRLEVQFGNHYHQYRLMTWF